MDSDSFVESSESFHRFRQEPGLEGDLSSVSVHCMDLPGFWRRVNLPYSSVDAISAPRSSPYRILLSSVNQTHFPLLDDVMDDHKMYRACMDILQLVQNVLIRPNALLFGVYTTYDKAENQKA